jgi:hypothetical protein
MTKWRDLKLILARIGGKRQRRKLNVSWEGYGRDCWHCCPTKTLPHVTPLRYRIIILPTHENRQGISLHLFTQYRYFVALILLCGALFAETARGATLLVTNVNEC